MSRFKLTPEEVAEALGISVETLTELIKERGKKSKMLAKTNFSNNDLVVLRSLMENGLSQK